ncbi:MAG: hypothetical protein BWY06_02392 [Candidatus Latescibacteria bacterium ADurb.Bin168]|nr:MAG: hypothetical protein BWY06_02392 [Candidatus Latescibacteria bacterium ADurb.Bin168]
MGAGGFVRRRVVSPVVDLLKQGVTPEKIALSMIVGGALGVFPVLGSTTILCTLAAFLLRLNMPAIQIVNYVVFPLQLLLLIPFARFGERIFHANPIPFSASEMVAMFQSDFLGSMNALWVTGLHAIVAWCVFMPPAAVFAYLVLVPGLRRILARLWRADSP